METVILLSDFLQQCCCVHSYNLCTFPLVALVLTLPLVKPSTSAEPPVFVKRLEANTVWKRGATARLQGSVTGSPMLHTSWFFNNSELCTGGRYELSLKDGVASLEVQGVDLSDSGNYTCEVLNESGCESCSTKVTVKGVWRGLQTPKVPNEFRSNHSFFFHF